jgi:hypothetical protein
MLKCNRKSCTDKTRRNMHSVSTCHNSLGFSTSRDRGQNLSFFAKHQGSMEDAASLTWIAFIVPNHLP